MKKVYSVKFGDGSKISFYLNDLSGYYYGELWITNPKILSKNKFTLADSIEFKDSTIEGFMKQVKDFISDKFNSDFLIEEVK